MTISVTPLNDCDCCGYGFELFTSPVIPIGPNYVYTFAVTGGAFGPTRVEKRSKDDFSLLGTNDLTALDSNGRRGFAVNTAEEFISLWRLDISRIFHLYKFNFNGSLLLDNQNYLLKAGSNLSSNANEGYSNLRFGYAAGDKYFVGGTFTDWISGPHSSHVAKNNCRITKLATNGTTEEWMDEEVSPITGNQNAGGFNVTSFSPDKNGGVAIAGNFNRVSDSTQKPFIIAYDTDGNRTWDQIDTTTGSTTVLPTATYHLNNGNLLVVYSAATGSQKILIAYDSSGSEVFSFTATALGNPNRIVVFHNAIIYNPGGGTTLEKRSGSTLSTIDWSVTVSGLSSTSNFEVDGNGFIYIASGTGGDNLKKLDGEDGSLLLNVSGGVTFELNVLCPPGVSPIFF